VVADVRLGDDNDDPDHQEHDDGAELGDGRPERELAERP
jgi:hypothetical protein